MTTENLDLVSGTWVAFSTAPQRHDVAVLWLPCLYLWQRPFAKWLWVWPHDIPEHEWREQQFHRGWKTQNE